MRFFVCIALLVTAVNAGGYGYSSGQTKLYDTVELKRFVPIVRLVGETDNAGNYKYESESGDGSKQSETGNMKNINGQLGSVKSGKVSWTSPEGQHFSYSYTADEHGFQPIGEHLIIPPVAAEENQRILNLSSQPEEVRYTAAVSPVRNIKADYSYYPNYESAAVSAVPVSTAPAVPVSTAPAVPVAAVPVSTVPVSAVTAVPVSAVPSVSMISINNDAVAAPETILSAPLPLPILMPKAPLKTHVKTPEYEIDSDMSRTFVRIGQY